MKTLSVSFQSLLFALVLGLMLSLSACQGESYNPGVLVRDVTYYGAEILTPGGGRVIVPAKVVPLGDMVELTLAVMQVPTFPGEEPGVTRLSNYLILGPDTLVFSEEIEIQILYADHAYGNLSDTQQVLRVAMYKTEFGAWNWEKVEGTIDLTTRAFTGRTKTLGVFALFLEPAPEEIPDDTVTLPDDGSFDPDSCVCQVEEQVRPIADNNENPCGLFTQASLQAREDSCLGQVDLLNDQDQVLYRFSVDACSGDEVLLTTTDWGECWFSWPSADQPQSDAILDCHYCQDHFPAP